MKTFKVLMYGLTGFMIFFSLSNPSMSSERGAKSLFYDPVSAGTQPDESKSDVTGTAPDGTTAKPADAYYDHLNPGILYWIELVHPETANNKRVSNDRVFRSGDRIRLHITANSDGYLRILHKGSTESMQMIPVPQSENGFIRMGADYVIPSESGWLRFDENPGSESLKLIFASVKSSGDVIDVMKSTADQTAPAVPEKLVALYDQYKGSKSLVSEVESGSKDLIIEGIQPADAKSQTAAPFNIAGTAGFKTDPAVYDAPANYIVNTNVSVKEPVVVDIVLNHQP